MSTPTPGPAPLSGQPGDTGTPPAGQEPASTEPTSTPPVPTGDDHAATIARLEADLAAARKEAGKSRVTAKQAAADQARTELAQQIGKALGIVQDDTPPDPQQLTQQLAAEQAKARQTAVELAVYRAASAAGANPDALLDSRAFADAVAQVDPNDRDGITTAIRTAIEANPRLAAQQVPAGPAKGGAEFGTPASTEVTPQQFAAMDYAARTALYESDPDTYRRLAG
jgi:hypothetical protein